MITYTKFQPMCPIETAPLVCFQCNNLKDLSGCCHIRRLLDCAVSPLKTWSDFLEAVQVPWSCKDMDCMSGGFVIE